jgi:hypothetical protein
MLGRKRVADVLDVALSMLIGTVGTILFVGWDERRLPPEAQERAWPLSTRLAAGLAFGPLSIPVHFFRTRRTVRGTLAGIAIAILFVIGIGLVSEVIDLVIR